MLTMSGNEVIALKILHYYISLILTELFGYHEQMQLD